VRRRCVGGCDVNSGSGQAVWEGWERLGSCNSCLSSPRITRFAPRLPTAVQGMVPLIDVTEDVGGLQVVPRSHSDEAKAGFRERHPEMDGIGESV